MKKDGYNPDNFYLSPNSDLWLSESLMKPYKNYIESGVDKGQRASREYVILDTLLDLDDVGNGANNGVGINGANNGGGGGDVGGGDVGGKKDVGGGTDVGGGGKNDVGGGGYVGGKKDVGGGTDVISENLETKLSKIIEELMKLNKPNNNDQHLKIIELFKTEFLKIIENHNKDILNIIDKNNQNLQNRDDKNRDELIKEINKYGNDILKIINKIQPI